MNPKSSSITVGNGVVKISLYHWLNIKIFLLSYKNSLATTLFYYCFFFKTMTLLAYTTDVIYSLPPVLPIMPSRAILELPGSRFMCQTV